NILSAFMTGNSTVDEDKIVLAEFSTNEHFQDMFDIINEIDAMDNMDELRKEFNENSDQFQDFNEHKINVK
ncbi:MAG: hypothetical protein KBT06_08660, partial [Prevotellaceae bacterium]|nr:hypothetical protein [Candidatus Colivivens equi]